MVCLPGEMLYSLRRGMLDLSLLDASDGARWHPVACSIARLTELLVDDRSSISRPARSSDSEGQNAIQ